jgi:hypothetical protein
VDWFAAPLKLPSEGPQAAEWTGSQWTGLRRPAALRRAEPLRAQRWGKVRQLLRLYDGQDSSPLSATYSSQRRKDIRDMGESITAAPPHRPCAFNPPRDRYEGTGPSTPGGAWPNRLPQQPQPTISLAPGCHAPQTFRTWQPWIRALMLSPALCQPRRRPRILPAP